MKQGNTQVQRKTVRKGLDMAYVMAKAKLVGKGSRETTKQREEREERANHFRKTRLKPDGIKLLARRRAKNKVARKSRALNRKSA